MFMTSEEFEALLKKNPKLRVRNQQKQPQKSKLQEIDLAPAKSNKYWNVKVYVYEDGFVSEMKDITGHGKISETYDSRREYARYLQLEILQQAGKISELSRQRTLIIAPACEYQKEHLRAITYKADYAYMEGGRQVIEDVKALCNDGSTKTTEAFRIKWKLLKMKYSEFDFRIF